MALDIMSNQRALHESSKTITKTIKSSSKTGIYSLAKAVLDQKAYPNGSPPTIPSREIFNSLYEDETNNADDVYSIERDIHLPSTAQCAVHLEFLTALWTLRQRVLRSDELDAVFEIKPIYKYVDRKGVQTKLKDSTLWDRRQIKWETFVRIAVARFLAWWEKVPEIVGARKGPYSYELTRNTLPPLDVLMVWHSFLLNPWFFRRSCNGGKKTLYNIDFPWACIHEAINSENWTFSLNARASSVFLRKTRGRIDIIEHLLEWKPYSLEVRKRNLELMRFSPGTCEVTALASQNVPFDDLLLFQSFIDANETIAHSLCDAATRQVSFIDKMYDRLWIRSPALSGTLQRARDRFRNFLRLFKLYPTQMLVPTLDIDIVWHTHQCAPAEYFRTTQEVAGKFVNHDDSIVKDKLDTGFEATKDLYRIEFGQEYQVCGCWDCEALQSAVERTEEDLDNEPDWESIAAIISKDVTYYREIEAARRKSQSVARP